MCSLHTVFVRGTRFGSSCCFSTKLPGEQAEVAARKLGIPHFARHIFLCADQTKPKCCSKKAGLESWDFLKRRLKEVYAEGETPKIGRTKANCLQICKDGPIAVVFDAFGATWYKEATPDVLEEIIQQHLLGGMPVSRYVICKNVDILS